jgi:phage terminase large subunit-like protein
MKIRIPMRQAINDERLLGLALPGSSWSGWHSLLIALTGAELTDTERVAFKNLTKREREPADGKLCECFLAIGGRRSGKTKSMAVYSAWLATCVDWSSNLSLGERGRILLVAPGMDQARVLLTYIRDIFQASPKLKAAIKNETTDQIELINGITLEVTTASAARSRALRLRSAWTKAAS